MRDMIVLDVEVCEPCEVVDTADLTDEVVIQVEHLHGMFSNIH